MTTTVPSGGFGNPNPWFGIAPLPTATLSANPTSVSSNTSTSTLTWSSTDATACTGLGFDTANATSGHAIVTPGIGTTFGVTCTSNIGQDSDYAAVSVVLPDLNISVSPSRIIAGATSTIAWSADNVSGCTLQDDSGLIIDTQTAVGGSANDTLIVGPITRTTNYTLTCAPSSGGSATSSAAVISTVPQFIEF